MAQRLSEVSLHWPSLATALLLTIFLVYNTLDVTSSKLFVISVWETPTSTFSPTGSPSATITGSPTNSGTPSRTATCTASDSLSGTPTGSETLSQTDTASLSLTGTASLSLTGTASLLLTGTASLSLTGTASLSATPSVSHSQSVVRPSPPRAGAATSAQRLASTCPAFIPLWQRTDENTIQLSPDSVRRCNVSSIAHDDVLLALSGTHIAFIGDSITRYQYVSLVYFLTTGSWTSPPPSNVRESVWPSWPDFLVGSSARIVHEQCDCFRPEGHPADLSVFAENRFYQLPKRGVMTAPISVTFLQWFLPCPLNGHNFHFWAARIARLRPVYPGSAGLRSTTRARFCLRFPEFFFGCSPTRSSLTRAFGGTTPRVPMMLTFWQICCSSRRGIDRELFGRPRRPSLTRPCRRP